MVRAITSELGCELTSQNLLEGEFIGWAALRYERLPNFCYWCGHVSYDDQDCKRWLQIKGTLTKSDQNYREWLKVEVDLSICKTSIVVFGVKPHKLVPPTKEHDDPKTQQLATLVTKDKSITHPDLAIPNKPTPTNQRPDKPKLIDENVTHHLLLSDFQEPIAVTDNESGTNSSINPGTFTTQKNVTAIYDFESGTTRDSSIINLVIKVELTNQTQPKPHLDPLVGLPTLPKPTLPKPTHITPTPRHIKPNGPKSTWVHLIRETKT